MSESREGGETGIQTAPRPELERIREIVGEDGWSTDPIDMLAYSRDLAPVPDELLHSYGMISPDLVVRPRSVEQVVEIVKVANEHNIPLTPRGGGSFALGGAIPIEGGVVLDLNGLNQVLEINETDRWVRVQSGVVWRRLIDQLAPMGLTAMANPSSGVSATIGGYLGTGGGAGIGVPRHGPLGNSVLSLKVVLPDGSVIETDPWESWRFIGAEGTLGIVCEAALKLVPLRERRFFMFAFDDLGKGIRALRRLAALKPYFLHFLDCGAVTFLNDAQALDDGGAEEHPTLDAAAMTIVVGFDGTTEVLNRIDDEVRGICVGAKRYADERAMREWEERYKIEISFKRLGPTLMVQEIRLPMAHLEAAMSDLANTLRGHQWGVQCLSSDHESVCLLIYALTDERDKLRFYRALSLARDIPRIGYRNHGTVYGFALHNSSHLTRVHGRSAVETMRAMKRRLDPRNIMNPSKTVQTRVPGPLVDISMLFMARAPGLMRLGLQIVGLVPTGFIRFGLRLVGGQLR